MVPLALAVRYPLLGWRIGWLGLLLVPLLDLGWWGGLPWDPAQILVVLVLLCAAGIRHERAVLWLAVGADPRPVVVLDCPARA